MKYKTICPICKNKTNDINSFYCVKNTGKCEVCLRFKIKNGLENSLTKWNRKKRWDEKPVDKFLEGGVIKMV